MESTTQMVRRSGRIVKGKGVEFDEELSFEDGALVEVLIRPLTIDYSDISEEEWLRMAARNPAFADLYDPEEDIYSPDEGVPFNEEG